MKLNIVPARTGLAWVKDGIRTYFRQPLALTALFFMYSAAFSVVTLIPVIGLVLAFALVPGATLGLMAATQEAAAGRFPMPTLLVSAFRAGRQRLRAMLVLGFIYAALCLALAVLVPMFAGLPPPSPNATATEAMASPEFLQAALLGSLFYLPISLMFWHAPALVHWHGVSPVKSLFFSFVACVRNGGALFMYGLGWMGLVFAAATLAVLIGGITGSERFVGTILVPLGLLLTAMFYTSTWFTFRDSFLPDDDKPTGAEAP